jgi:heme/copper-type cytochrome/quinol oxidase subunit 4
VEIFFWILFVGPAAVCVAIYANRKKRSAIIWFLLSILITFPLAFLILLIMGSPPVTKKRLIIFVCVICLVIGWFYYLIIQQEQQGIKAKMIEVINSMSNVASAVTAYNQDLNSWPHCDNIVAIRTSLGVSISTDKISSITVTSPRAEEVIITATIKGIDSGVDEKNLTLTGKPSERGVLWTWGGTVPPTYVPKK